MTRTLEALRLIVDELEEHSKRLGAVEKEQTVSKKVADHQAREIEQLRTRIRDLEIREKSRLGIKKKNLAEEYGLTPGRISQITKTQ